MAKKTKTTAKKDKKTKAKETEDKEVGLFWRIFTNNGIDFVEIVSDNYISVIIPHTFIEGIVEAIKNSKNSDERKALNVFHNTDESLRN